MFDPTVSKRTNAKNIQERGVNMATKVKDPAKRAVKQAPAEVADTPAPTPTSRIPARLQGFLKETSIPKDYVNSEPQTLTDVRSRMNALNLKTKVPELK